MLKMVWLVVVLPLLIYLLPIAGFLYYLHTPEGRKTALAKELIAYFDYHCPANRNVYKELESLQLTSLPSPHEPIQAPTKRVWSLILNQTSEFQVTQWLKRKRMTCSKSRYQAHHIKCIEVPVSKLELLSDTAQAEIDFGFTSTGVLQKVGVLFRNLDSEDAQTIFKALSLRMEKRFGTSNIIERRPLFFSVEYRFTDYAAKLTVVKLPKSGLTIYEQYLHGSAEPSETIASGEEPFATSQSL